MAGLRSGATGRLKPSSRAVRVDGPPKRDGRLIPSRFRHPHMLFNGQVRYFRPDDPDSVEPYEER